MACVLMVDDDQSTALVLQSMVRDTGHQMCVASYGREALELLSQQRPAVVLSDVVMPHIGGVELARVIQGNRALDSTKIMLMSALTRPATNGTYQAFIPKPFDMDDVLAVIDRLADGA